MEYTINIDLVYIGQSNAWCKRKSRVSSSDLKVSDDMKILKVSKAYIFP